MRMGWWLRITLSGLGRRFLEGLTRTLHYPTSTRRRVSLSSRPRMSVPACLSDPCGHLTRPKSRRDVSNSISAYPGRPVGSRWCLLAPHPSLCTRDTPDLSSPRTWLFWEGTGPKSLRAFWILSTSACRSARAFFSSASSLAFSSLSFAAFSGSTFAFVCPFPVPRQQHARIAQENLVR